MYEFLIPTLDQLEGQRPPRCAFWCCSNFARKRSWTREFCLSCVPVQSDPKSIWIDGMEKQLISFRLHILTSDSSPTWGRNRWWHRWETPPPPNNRRHFETRKFLACKGTTCKRENSRHRAITKTRSRTEMNLHSRHFVVISLFAGSIRRSGCVWTSRYQRSIDRSRFQTTGSSNSGGSGRPSHTSASPDRF